MTLGFSPNSQGYQLLVKPVTFPSTIIGEYLSYYSNTTTYVVVRFGKDVTTPGKQIPPDRLVIMNIIMVLLMIINSP